MEHTHTDQLLPCNSATIQHDTAHLLTIPAKAIFLGEIDHFTMNWLPGIYKTFLPRRKQP
jgi:hypothetical protein